MDDQSPLNAVDYDKLRAAAEILERLDRRCGRAERCAIPVEQHKAVGGAMREQVDALLREYFPNGRPAS